MQPTDDFPDWMDRVRRGDSEAAAELVRRYEKAVRVAVRLKLTDPRLRRQFDSMDVCQSVMASFFVRAAAGQFDLENPQQLVALLMRMAQNKFLGQARHHFQAKRDVGQIVWADGDAVPLADATPGPDRQVEGREQLENLLAKLTPEERELANRRSQRQTWVEMAAELGGTPQGHRMRLTRALDRVAAELGLDEGNFSEDD